MFAPGINPRQFLNFKIMNPLAVGAILLTIGALAYTFLGIAKAAIDLRYSIQKFRFYQIKLTKMIFELVVRFSNPSNNPIVVQMIDLAVYVDAQYTTINNNGKISYNITNSGLRLCQINDTKGFRIAANKITDKSFYPEITILDIVNATLSKIIEKIRTGSVDRPKNVLIAGYIKAEGVNINIVQVVPFS